MFGSDVGQIEAFVFLIAVSDLPSELSVVLFAVIAHKVDDPHCLVVVGHNLYLA